MKYILVISTVLCTLASALALDYGAKSPDKNAALICMVIGFALVMNFLKIIIWKIIYTRYSLGSTYPAVAAFYPIVYAAGLIQGTTQIEPTKIIAITLIILGMSLLSEKSPD